jgi:hypothetical protein
MSQQSVRQAARRSTLDAQAARRRERADRERRLEALAVAVLTALGERDRAVKDAETRAGEGTADPTCNAAFWPSGRVSAAPTVLHRSRRRRRRSRPRCRRGVNLEESDGVGVCSIEARHVLNPAA